MKRNCISFLKVFDLFILLSCHFYCNNCPVKPKSSDLVTYDNRLNWKPTKLNQQQCIFERKSFSDYVHARSYSIITYIYVTVADKTIC